MKVKIKLFLLILLLTACNENYYNKTSNKLFYISHNKNHDYYDTIPYLQSNNRSTNDSLIHQISFDYNGKRHILKMTTNEYNAGKDGGVIRYHLDDIGIIYTKSTTWYSYSRLKSDNDSLNELIDRALENIILHKEFTCVEFAPTERKEIKFN